MIISNLSGERFVIVSLKCYLDVPSAGLISGPSVCHSAQLTAPAPAPEVRLVSWCWSSGSGSGTPGCHWVTVSSLSRLSPITNHSVSPVSAAARWPPPGAPAPLPPSPRLGPLRLRLRQWPPPPAHPGCLRHTTYTRILAFGNMHFLGDLVNTDIDKNSIEKYGLWFIKPSLLSGSPVASFNGPWLSSMLRGAGRERRLSVTHVNIDNCCRIPSTCPSQACHVCSLTN